MSHKDEIITAAIIAIGDELLSGRTKDKNIGYLAEKLTEHGIELKEVRIIGDEEDMIVATVQAMMKHYDYVFTSGGIGPTHDDITAPAIAKAVGRPCIYDPRAEKLLIDFYASRNTDYTTARRQMARMPKDSTLIKNSVSVAPGFIVDNIYIMAGVPQVFQVMVDEILPTLKKGAPMLSRSLPCAYGEGIIGTYLSKIQDNNMDTEIGSYPHYESNAFSLELVIRSRNNNALNKAYNDIQEMIEQLNKQASLDKEF